MPENISPEEKLFKVIQNGKKNPPPIKKGNNMIAGMLSGASFAIPFNLDTRDLKSANRLLVLVLVAVAAVAIFFLISRTPSIDRVSRQVAGIPVQLRPQRTIEAFKPLNYYVEEVNERDIFQPTPKDPEEIEIPPEDLAPEETLLDLAATLKLQGISWGGTPKAMVKDTSDNQMYFLKEGQAVGATGIKIKTIEKNRIVLIYGEEELELM